MVVPGLAVPWPGPGKGVTSVTWPGSGAVPVTLSGRTGEDSRPVTKDTGLNELKRIDKPSAYLQVKYK